MTSIEIPTLRPEDIEVKVKKVGEKGTQVLLYKTARTDMEYLDKCFGIGNWQCEYTEIKGNLYCSILLWDDDKEQWVKKPDCGIESREDGEGNEKKGEASDSFKRAGFKVGIGRELYSSPFIFIKASDCPTEKNEKGIWKLKDAFTKFAVTDIEYDGNRKITRLVVVNERTGGVVYTYGNSNQKRTKTEEKETKPAPKQNTPPKNAEAPKQDIPAIAQKVNAVVETSASIPNPNEKPYEKVVANFLKNHQIDKKKFAELRAYAVRNGNTDVTQKKFTELTSDEWIFLIATMENLFDSGFFDDAMKGE